MRYLAGGRYEFNTAVPINAGWLLGSGLFLSAGTGLVGILIGQGVLQTAIIQFDVVLLGHVKLVTSLFFDVGVYLLSSSASSSTSSAAWAPRSTARSRRRSPGEPQPDARGGLRVLVACGVALLLERTLTRVLVGIVLLGNGINILFLVASGRPGRAPILSAGRPPRR